MCVVSAVIDYMDRNVPFQSFDWETADLLRKAIDILEKIDARLGQPEWVYPVKAEFLEKIMRAVLADDGYVIPTETDAPAVDTIAGGLNSSFEFTTPSADRRADPDPLTTTTPQYYGNFFSSSSIPDGSVPRWGDTSGTTFGDYRGIWLSVL